MSALGACRSKIAAWHFGLFSASDSNAAAALVWTEILRPLISETNGCTAFRSTTKS